MSDYRPTDERAKIICTGCGATIAMAPAGAGPGTGRCSRCALPGAGAQQAVPGSQPVPGTRALRRRAFGHRRSRQGRLSQAQKRHAADLGLIVP